MVNTGPVIDFIIGIVFYWYVLGGVIMQVLEYYASVRKWRAKGLYDGIHHMLGDGVLTDMLYQHPIILGLYGSERRNRLPSYIPARQFSLALFDILFSADREIFLIKYQLLKIKNNLEVLHLSRRREAAELEADRILQLCTLSDSLDYKDNESFRNLLVATIEKDLDTFANNFPELHSVTTASQTELVTMQEKIKSFSGEFKDLSTDSDPNLKSFIFGLFVFSVLSPKLGGVFGGLLKGLPKDIRDKTTIEVNFRENAENWYNDAMDRLSGWYKRKSSLAAFSIGILIALFFNIDSIEFARHLWRDASLQWALQSAAVIEIEGGEAITIERLEQNGYFSIPIGWGIEEIPLKNCTVSEKKISLKLWDYCYRIDSVNSDPNGWYGVLEKILGLTISAVAGSQGASFWFDTLQKIINVRLSGKKPENLHPAPVG